MSEEEKETIDRLYIKAISYSVEAPDYPNTIVFKKDLVRVLNLIEKQQKENKKLRKKCVELRNDNQLVTSIKIIEITPSDELAVIHHDNVILQEIKLSDKGYKVSFYDCKKETEKAEWVSLDAIFYFDNRGLQIEIDHY